ncbi:Rpn family recombination-promoting nuclease/putative transposase [Nostoc sp.]|uniref:Rpn family recombination-promoting nuclease/putative transposase n=1 Tax=Nostoc sp. TaxID=1180 RepID=UPI002FFA8736
MQTDKIFYSLFQAFPSIFFANTTANVNAYEFVSIELKETAFRIDGVFIPTSETTNQPLYFVEVQFQLDSNFYRRFFAEIFLYLRQNKSVNFWRAVVIYPQRSLDPNDRLPYQLLLDNLQMQRIYLDELDSTENSLQVAIVKLIIEREETAVDKGRELILQARQQLTDESTTKQIVELIETILLYKFTRLSREELAQMLAIDDEFKKTRMYQSIKEDGLEEGRHEGRQEGRQEAKLEAIPRLLALGLSVEQVAVALDLTVAQVQQAAQNQSI